MKYLTRIASYAAILALTFGITGCKKAPPIDDHALATALQAKLAGESALTSEPIQLTVQNAVATLNGNVSSDAARSLAASDAAQVAGIKTVVNNLTVATTAAATPPPPIKSVKPVKPSAMVAQLPPPPVPVGPSIVEAPPQPPPAPIVQQGPPAPEASPTPPPLTFRNVTIPAGTIIPVRITQTLDSATTQTGDAFSGSIAVDIIADGLVAIPQGAGVSGRVDDAKDATHYTGSSRLSVSLVSIDRHGERIPVVTGSFAKEGAARGKNTAEKVGGGAAVGAILGGIFGGGKGAAIGAAAGGGAGAGANTVTRGQQVQIPSESIVRVQLTNPIVVRVSTDDSAPANDGSLQRH